MLCHYFKPLWPTHSKQMPLREDAQPARGRRPRTRRRDGRRQRTKGTKAPPRPTTNPGVARIRRESRGRRSCQGPNPNLALKATRRRHGSRPNAFTGRHLNYPPVTPFQPRTTAARRSSPIHHSQHPPHQKTPRRREKKRKRGAASELATHHRRTRSAPSQGRSFPPFLPSFLPNFMLRRRLQNQRSPARADEDATIPDP